jgi:hypothetical protein
MGSEPPRPDVAPAAFEGSEFDDGHYAEPAKRNQKGVLIGVGGVVAIGAILAAVFLWPSNSNATSGAGNSTDLTPSNSAPAATEKAAPKGNGGTRSTPRTTPKAPSSTAVDQPPSTENPPSSSEDQPTESPSTKPSNHAPASGENKPSRSGRNTPGSAQSTPGASSPTADQDFGGQPTTPQATVSSPNTAPNGLDSGTPSGYPTASGGPAPAGQSWARDGAGGQSIA